MTRLDASYFAVRVFSTVGFGDITAVSEFARIFTTVQMVLGLVLLGCAGRSDSTSSGGGDQYNFRKPAKGAV